MTAAGAYTRLIIAPILWGSALVAGRIAAAELEPVTIVWVRFLLVALFLLPVVRVREGRLPRPTSTEWGLIVLLGLTGVVIYNYLLFSGLTYNTAVRSAVIMALTPALVAIVNVVAFRERADLFTAAGIVLAFAGAAVTVTDGRFRAVLAQGVSIGDGFMLGAATAWAVYTILARYSMGRLSALTVLSYSSVVGVVVLTPFGVRSAGLAAAAGQSPAAWLALTYLAVFAAGVAYLFYYEGIRAVGSTRAAVFLNIEPVAAMALGVALLDERVSPSLAAGAVLVIGGLFLVNRPRPRHREH